MKYNSITRAFIIKMYPSYRIHHFFLAFGISTRTVMKILKIKKMNLAKYPKRVKIPITLYDKVRTLRSRYSNLMKWLDYLKDHQFNGDFLTLACEGEKPP